MMFGVKIFRKQIKPADPSLVVQVEQRTPYCHCHIHGEPEVTLRGIARADSGWVAKGTVTRCPICAAAAVALRKELPIVAKEFRCPICQKAENLEYQITEINEVEDGKTGYQFEVRISCKPCKTKRALKQFKDSLAKTSKIEVTPKGITFN